MLSSAEPTPKTKRNVKNFEDIINIFKENDELSKKDLEKILSRSERTVRGMLTTLEKWNIIILRRVSIYKLWNINPDLLKNKRRLNMAKKDIVERVKEVMNDPTHIRNVATSSHVHHGMY